VVCLSCANFVCHDCVVALHAAIEIDHPTLQDPWVQATRNTSRNVIIEIAVGHCCVLKDYAVQPETLPLTMQTTAVEAILAGANHYYQYDLIVGSTPATCVDVFSLGASGSNAAVTHAVFPVHIAMSFANEHHSIQNLELIGPIVNVPSRMLLSLPKSFSKESYKIKVVTINSTTSETPLLGKHTDLCNELWLIYMKSHQCLFNNRFLPRYF
jgi:hypothetical protein